MTADPDPRAGRLQPLPRSGLQGDRAEAAVRGRQGVFRRRLPRGSTAPTSSCSPRPAIVSAGRRRAPSPARSKRSTARSTSPASTYTGEVEDFFFLVEGELKKRLGPDVAGRLHTGRSRNDIDHTLFRLRLKAEIDGLADEAAPPDRDADRRRRARARHDHPRLHPRPAGAALDLRPLSRRRDRGAAARRRRGWPRRAAIVDLSPMGAAAITTSGFPLDRARVAGLLGFAAPTGNSYGSIAAVDYITGDLFGDRTDLPASRPADPGPAVLDQLRGRPDPRAGRLRADLLDHAAEAQSRCRSSICATSPRRRWRAPAPMLDDHAQHALHRHERQRGRDAGRRATRPSPPAAASST